MIENYQNWNSAYISGKQFMSGIGLIAFALLFIISDVLISLRNLKRIIKSIFIVIPNPFIDAVFDVFRAGFFKSQDKKRRDEAYRSFQRPNHN